MGKSLKLAIVGGDERRRTSRGLAQADGHSIRTFALLNGRRTSPAPLTLHRALRARMPCAACSGDTGGKSAACAAVGYENRHHAGA